MRRKWDILFELFSFMNQINAASHTRNCTVIRHLKFLLSFHWNHVRCSAHILLKGVISLEAVGQWRAVSPVVSRSVRGGVRTYSSY